MARKTGIYRRRGSRFWWIVVLPGGRRVCLSTRTENRDEAGALRARLKVDSFREPALGVKPRRTRQEAVIRHLTLKATLRSIGSARLILRKLDPYLGSLDLNEIDGDLVWKVIKGELAKGNKPATVNRYLAKMRALLRMARDEWQWIDRSPKIRLLPGEVERDRSLTREEAERLIAASPPHLSAMIRFALSTGCRAREITGLEWSRVDLERRTAWLDRTKNGTPRGVPLNGDAVAVLESQRGKHPRFCFTYRGRPIAWELTNNAWHSAVRKAGRRSSRQRMGLPRTPWAWNGSRSPTALPRAQSEKDPRRSAGSAMARSGAPAAKVASVC